MSLPTPYFSDGQVVLYHGDAREILPGLGLKDVGLILTDPPYGIGLANHAPGRERRLESWVVAGDSSRRAGAEVLALCQAWGWPTIAFAHPQHPWPGSWRQHLVWDKGPAVGGGGDPGMCWKQTWELIQVARTGDLNGPRDCAVLRYWITPQDSHLHICQKPVPLLVYLIGKATAPGALVVDPFCGSGSTLRAAANLGRRAIGIEVEERYCAIAVERLRQQVLPLFESAEVPA